MNIFFIGIVQLLVDGMMFSDCFWPNAADGVQDSSLLICKTHEFSR